MKSLHYYLMSSPDPLVHCIFTEQPHCLLSLGEAPRYLASGSWLTQSPPEARSINIPHTASEKQPEPSSTWPVKRHLLVLSYEASPSLPARPSSDRSSGSSGSSSHCWQLGWSTVCCCMGEVQATPKASHTPPSSNSHHSPSACRLTPASPAPYSNTHPGPSLNKVTVSGTEMLDTIPSFHDDER